MNETVQQDNTRMARHLERLAEIWSRDGIMLGLTQRRFRRIEGVNPGLLLYEHYVEVENYELGTVYFVPTDFIDDQISERDKAFLTVPYAEVLKRTWDRMPTFIARGESVIERFEEG